MAYTVYDELQLKNPKSVQYYPEEYDYPAYTKIPNVKPNYTPIQNAAKKSKKTTPSVTNYTNEKKCPIYVHQYNKSPVSSTYNNYSSLKTSNKSPAEKNPPSKGKRNHSSFPSKSVLDQLEETYWATWKPNKENNGNKLRKNRIANEEKINKNKAYGDTAETLFKYFATTEFFSTMSVFEDDRIDKYKQTLELTDAPTVQRVTEKQSSKLVTTNTQQIQTEGYPLILPKIEEKVESVTNVEKSYENNDKNELDEVKSEGEVPEAKSDNEEVIEKEKSDSEEESKTLKHTDSLIINKKKQSEVKEHFQQPRCIKLYRKPGASTSFIRGGSYPLKSCLKRESPQKGNFKLGAPGSPMLITTSFYNRKSRK